MTTANFISNTLASWKGLTEFLYFVAGFILLAGFFGVATKWAYPEKRPWSFVLAGVMSFALALVLWWDPDFSSSSSRNLYVYGLDSNITIKVIKGTNFGPDALVNLFDGGVKEVGSLVAPTSKNQEKIGLSVMYIGIWTLMFLTLYFVVPFVTFLLAYMAIGAAGFFILFLLNTILIVLKILSSFFSKKFLLADYMTLAKNKLDRLLNS